MRKIDAVHATLVFICLVAVIMFGAIINISVGDINQRKAAEEFGIILENTGLTVLEGIIQSPSVIIVVDGPFEFMETVRDHYQDVVYYYPKRGYYSARSYFVFNDDMTIAWKYTPGK